jgi:hypothetical protein
MTTTSRRRVLIIAQFGASLAILAWVPGNWLKLGAFLVCWAITFRTLGRREILFWLAAMALFSSMDAAALSRGIFAFSRPDFLGMPAWEPFCWGFFMLHTMRLIGGPPPASTLRTGIALAVVLALPFMVITEPRTLLIAGGLLLAAALLRFQDRLDLAYTGYMIAIGCAWEYVGVAAGQWSYPNDPMSGVPLWFIPMWGSVGLATRRLILPLVYEGREDPSQAHCHMTEKGRGLRALVSGDSRAVEEG